MSIEQLSLSLPEYAKDLKLNLSSLLRTQLLNETQLWGALVTAAITTGNRSLAQAVEEDARAKLDETALNAAKAAATIMGMNNIFYRFRHLVSEKKYEELPAKLRMNVIRGHGANQVDFELWSLVASAINGCGVCVDSHEQALRREGVSHDQIQEAVRVAAVLNGIAKALG